MNSAEFTCDCGKTKGWITEGKYTKPCPKCGRVYKGQYDKDNLSIAHREAWVAPTFCGAGYFVRFLRWCRRPRLPLQWWVNDCCPGGKNWCKTTWRNVLRREHRGQVIRLGWP